MRDVNHCGTLPFAVEDSVDLLYGVVDEIGIDVDRFRTSQEASLEQMYLTGIEFALAVSAWVVARFLQGYIRGLISEAALAGVDPAAVGEQLGRMTVRQAEGRIGSLLKRTKALQQSTPAEVMSASEEVAAELDDILTQAVEAQAGLEETSRDVVMATAVGDLHDSLVENGFADDEARALAERIADRLSGSL